MGDYKETVRDIYDMCTVNAGPLARGIVRRIEDHHADYFCEPKKPSLDDVCTETAGRLLYSFGMNPAGYDHVGRILNKFAQAIIKEAKK